MAALYWQCFIEAHVQTKKHHWSWPVAILLMFLLPPTDPSTQQIRKPFFKFKYFIYYM